MQPEDIALMIEEGLGRFLPPAEQTPRKLHSAMREAVLRGGKRLRPRLLLQVAHACGAHETDDLDLALRAACAVELIHSASLVHDDLPCFDDAAKRRGRPAIHLQFGQAMAILAGDALLARAFELLAEAPAGVADRTLSLIRLLGAVTGSATGIIGGQSLEEDAAGQSDLGKYHRMKTGAPFVFSAEAGALVAGGHVAAWARVGQLFGTWYQLADDFIDASARATCVDKPVGRDAALGRPNAVLAFGLDSVASSMRDVLSELRADIARLTQSPASLLHLIDQTSGEVQRIVASA